MVEAEEVEEEVVVVVSMALLRLWDMLNNDFERNPLMNGRTDGRADSLIEMRGRI